MQLIFKIFLHFFQNFFFAVEEIMSGNKFLSLRQKGIIFHCNF